jgi:hypothetical protein
VESSQERAQALNGEKIRERIARRRRDLALGMTKVKHFGVEKVEDGDHERVYKQTAGRDLASILAAAAAREVELAAEAAGDED